MLCIMVKVTSRHHIFSIHLVIEFFFGRRPRLPPAALFTSFFLENQQNMQLYTFMDVRDSINRFHAFKTHAKNQAEAGESQATMSFSNSSHLQLKMLIFSRQRALEYEKNYEGLFNLAFNCKALSKKKPSGTADPLPAHILLRFKFLRVIILSKYANYVHSVRYLC